MALRVAVALALARGVGAAPTVTTFVDFSRQSATVPVRAFGVNSYQAFTETLKNRSGYVSNVAAMLSGGAGAPLGGFARLHREDMMTRDAATDANSWLQFNRGGAPTWNFTRIDAALAGLYWRGGAGVPVMLCVSAYPPAWANATANNKTMSEAHEADWVALAASLVAHLRTTLAAELPAELLWVELTNEWDASGYNPASLGRLVAAGAAAVRAAWPGVRAGGPAWARPDITDAVTGFLAVAGPHIDFVSYHAYCNGNTGASLKSVYACAGDPFVTVALAGIVPQYAAMGAAIALFHDEMNISWVSAPHRAAPATLLQI